MIHVEPPFRAVPELSRLHGRQVVFVPLVLTTTPRQRYFPSSFEEGSPEKLPS